MFYLLVSLKIHIFLIKAKIFIKANIVRFFCFYIFINKFTNNKISIYLKVKLKLHSIVGDYFLLY